MAKTPQKLINEAKEEIKKIMSAYMEEISVDLIAQISKNSKKLPVSQKVNATKNISSPAGQWFKSDLREAMGVIVREAIDMAKKEIPARIKFTEYDDLPAAVKRFIDAQITLYTSTQIEDMKKNLSFSYQDALAFTDNVKQIEKEMAMAAAKYIEGTAIAAASSKLTAVAVNNARKSYFDQPEVMDQIEAFQYMNDEPNAPICVNLKGHVFSADDPDLQMWTPPFHFNCDGWLRPILIGNLKNLKPERYTPTKAAQESVQFSETKNMCCDH